MCRAHSLPKPVLLPDTMTVLPLKSVSIDSIGGSFVYWSRRIADQGSFMLNSREWVELTGVERNESRSGRSWAWPMVSHRSVLYIENSRKYTSEKTPHDLVVNELNYRSHCWILVLLISNCRPAEDLPEGRVSHRPIPLLRIYWRSAIITRINCTSDGACQTLSYPVSDLSYICISA